MAVHSILQGLIEACRLFRGIGILHLCVIEFQLIFASSSGHFNRLTVGI